MKKAAIIAPFWNDPQHVGVYRIDRFKRWLEELNYKLIIIRAGANSGINENNWGNEIILKDPLGIYRKKENQDGSIIPARRPNRLRRFITNFIFIPDPLISWVIRVLLDKDVKKQIDDVDIIISSSPPEAHHITAYYFAMKHKKKLIIDMRDGWLDEPLKVVLHYKLRNWIEGILEKKVLKKADTIFVTSEVWKELLVSRLPFTKEKTVLLTNCYPTINLISNDSGSNSNGIEDNKIHLAYAGRFTDARPLRKIEYFLDPLYNSVQKSFFEGEIIHLGELYDYEKKKLDIWNSKLNNTGWNIKTLGRLPRQKMLEVLNTMNGLIMFSVTQSTIPSKLFEYLFIKKPILAFTPYKSAVWRIGEKLGQIFLIDIKDPSTFGNIDAYLQECKNLNHNYNIPVEFSEEYNKNIFVSAVNTVLGIDKRGNKFEV